MSQLSGFVFFGDVPVSFSGSFPESDSVLKYGDAVLTGINKNYTEWLLNFHLIGDQSKIGVVSECSQQTNKQTNNANKNQQCKQMAPEMCGSRRAVHFHMLWNVADLHLSHLGTNHHFLFSFWNVLALALMLSISFLLFPFCCHIANASVLSMLKCTQFPRVSALIIEVLASYTLICPIPATFIQLIIDRLFLPSQFPSLVTSGSLLVFLACNSRRRIAPRLFQAYVN